MDLTQRLNSRCYIDWLHEAVSDLRGSKVGIENKRIPYNEFETFPSVCTAATYAIGVQCEREVQQIQSKPGRANQLTGVHPLECTAALHFKLPWEGKCLHPRPEILPSAWAAANPQERQQLQRVEKSFSR